MADTRPQDEQIDDWARELIEETEWEPLKEFLTRTLLGEKQTEGME